MGLFSAEGSQNPTDSRKLFTPTSTAYIYIGKGACTRKGAILRDTFFTSETYWHNSTTFVYLTSHAFLWKAFFLVVFSNPYSFP